MDWNLMMDELPLNDAWWGFIWEDDRFVILKTAGLALRIDTEKLPLSECQERLGDLIRAAGREAAAGLRDAALAASAWRQAEAAVAAEAAEAGKDGPDNG